MATNGPSVLPTRHLAQLKEPTWNFTGSKAASELNAAKTARDAAQAEQEKLEREPAPLKLPVLNLEVKPAHFFWLAPLLLTTLYWNLALIEHALGRLLRGLREQMRVQSVDQSALAFAMPELGVAHATRFHRLRACLPDIATGAALVLLACSGYVSSIALAATVVTAAYRVRALVGSK